MNWLMSAGSLEQKQRPGSRINNGGVRPLNLQVNSHRTASQWRLFASPSGLTSGVSSKKMWQDVLSVLVEK